jgi:hypothetical protein
VGDDVEEAQELAVEAPALHTENGGRVQRFRVQIRKDCFCPS